MNLKNGKLHTYTRDRKLSANNRMFDFQNRNVITRYIPTYISSKAFLICKTLLITSKYHILFLPPALPLCPNRMSK